jgi:hypothetical protein
VGEPEARKPGSRWLSLLLVLVVLGLTAVVLYLSATINHRHYRLAVSEKHLLIERGRLLPMGFEALRPEAEALKDAYAPIPIPPGESVKAAEVFDDRSDLDRGIYMTLAGWARARMDAASDEEFELAETYVGRAELLPGLSEEQRLELRGLRADLALRGGKRTIAAAVNAFERAKRDFETAIKLGPSRNNEAERWLLEVERRLPALRDLSPTPGVAPVTPGTTPSSDVEPPRWRL